MQNILCGVITLLCLSGFLPSTGLAKGHNPATEQARMGMHGMLLFSDGQALFASHLPMYHSPHDVQLVFSLTLSDKELEQRLIDLLAYSKTYWTIAPQKFDLTKLGQETEGAVQAFYGDLYQGHFERGGEKRFSHQFIQFQQSKLRNILSPEKLSQRQYIRINEGESGVSFYALLIKERPGMDRIIRIEHADDSRILLPDHFFINMSEEPLADKDIAAQLQLPANRVTTIYLETGDLK